MSPLRAAPLTQLRPPTYPLRQAVLANPDLLRHYVPFTWRGKPEIAGLLSVALAAASAGCDHSDPPRQTTGAISADAAALVAPVFEHGKGVGWPRAGLVGSVIGFPVHLPEEDARAIILEELARVGINPSSQDQTMSTVIIDGWERKHGLEWVSGSAGETYEPIRGPLVVDLWEANRRIAIEYVSYDDFDRLGGNDRHAWGMNIKAVAESVGHEVEQQTKGIIFAAFYDPVLYTNEMKVKDEERMPGENWVAAQRRTALVADKEQLRLQVKDFIDWLKAQGVI